MKSFHGDPAIKQKYLERIRAHAAADEIIQGKYWENGKGCAVGCTIHGSDHKAYEVELGIPEWLARLEDKIFEGLPNAEAKLFPEQFIDAIPENVDLDPVKWKFCAFLLRENIDRVLSLDIDKALKRQVVDAIRGVLQLHETAIETGAWDESAAWSAWSAAWSAAESAAWSAAESAAWSAAESAAWSAAESAAWSAAESAWSAAESAAWSAAESAWSAAESAESAAESAWSAAESARSAAYERYRDELLRLLREAV